MLQREMYLNRALLVLVALLGCVSALEIGSCIRYQTYMATSYGMNPFQVSDRWFSHSLHFTPRVTTRVGIRTVRIYGCCNIGYKYIGYPVLGCQPVCTPFCPMNSYCSAPGVCSCNVGYYNTSSSECVPVGQTTAEVTLATTARTTTTPRTTTTLRTTTTMQPPCNGSCASNEVCSLLDDICICKYGYQRASGNTSTACVPSCDPGCHHADCVAPNSCSCWPHYERTNETSCHLRCTELSCVYGQCNENGVCECAQGFLNNGTSCVWAGDAILSEPDSCDCWSPFIWRRTATESRALQCVPLCTGSDPLETGSKCIDSSDCQCYEGFLVCHSHVYKCFPLETEPSVTALMATTSSAIAERVSLDESESSTKLTVLVVAFVAGILILGGVLWAWQYRRNWFNRLWSYNRMENGQE